MFTGIITNIGHVSDIHTRDGGDSRVIIAAEWDQRKVDLGMSICCSGVCLTVVEYGNEWFAVDVSAETLCCTTLGQWKTGQIVNLERSLKAGDELGGHIVSGHVDGVGKIKAIYPDGDSQRIEVIAENEIIRLVAKKGSIAVDGISLTVNEVKNNFFAVNVIPHTQAVTTLGKVNLGYAVNLEVDVLARYVARITEGK